MASASRHELIERAVPRGSSLHYALLYTPRPAQPGLRALFAFQRELTRIPLEVHEPDVALAKLEWWRGELERAGRGQAQHPIAQALAQTLLADHALDRAPLLGLIEGVRLDLEYGLYPSFRELSDYCHRVGSGIAELAATVCGCEDPETRRFAHDLGMALRLFSLLRNVRLHLDAGRLYIPEDELAQAGVDYAQLRGHRTTPAIRALFAQQAARIRDFFASALQRLPAADWRRQRGGVALAELYLALLTEMEAAGFPLLERRIHLTPINKFWIAWRATRRRRSRRDF